MQWPRKESNKGQKSSRGRPNGREAILKDSDTEDCDGCKRMMAGMTARPHKDTCRQRMESNLQKEENPRWNRAHCQKEEMFWEAMPARRVTLNPFDRTDCSVIQRHIK